MPRVSCRDDGQLSIVHRFERLVLDVTEQKPEDSLLEMNASSMSLGGVALGPDKCSPSRSVETF